MAHDGNISDISVYTAAGALDKTVMAICILVLYNMVCQIINIFGIVTNIINIVCFVKQGFKDSVNVSLLGLSISDLASLLTMVWSCIAVSVTVAEADVPYLSVEVAYLVSVMPHFAFVRVSSCITAMIALERCLSIVIPLKIKQMFTPQRTATMIVSFFVIFTLSSSPVYAVNRLGSKFSQQRNKTLFGLIFEKDKEQVEMYTFAVNNFAIPLCTFAILAICTAILSNHLRTQTEWRRTNISNIQADRISNRNLKAAKMVVTISILFIVCFVPSPIILLVVAFEPEISVNGKYMHESIIFCGIPYIIEGVNASMNIFIYNQMSSKYRDTLRHLFYKRGIKAFNNNLLNVHHAIS